MAPFTRQPKNEPKIVIPIWKKIYLHLKEKWSIYLTRTVFISMNLISFIYVVNWVLEHYYNIKLY